jgi:hypothetical protein
MPPERSEKPDSLEARLRRLPPPAVPAELEARLLAGIPARALSRRWTWYAVTALAAACLLIALLWPKGKEDKPDQNDNNFANNGSSNSVRPQTPADAIAPWSQARASDEPKLPPFSWPVEETTHVTLSSSIPSDLLD